MLHNPQRCSVMDIVQRVLGDPNYNDWCLVGGAAMAVYGIRKNNADIDVLVSPKLFKHLEASGLFMRTGSSDVSDCLSTIVQGCSLKLDILNAGAKEEWKVYLDLAIKNIGTKYKIINPVDLLSWKQGVSTGPNVAKHQRDAKLIETYLEDKSNGEGN